MRSLNRQKQRVWSSIVIEIKDGIDTIPEYAPLKEWRLTVSATSGTPDEIAAGIVPTYDRYITVYGDYNKGFRKEAVEGMALWIDVIPEIKEDGTLYLNEDDSPIAPPDYTLQKILATQKGIVARYGIKKNGGSYDEQEND